MFLKSIPTLCLAAATLALQACVSMPGPVPTGTDSCGKGQDAAPANASAPPITLPAPGVISPINLPPGHYTQDLGDGRTRTIIVEPRRPHQTQPVILPPKVR